MDNSQRLLVFNTVKGNTYHHSYCIILYHSAQQCSCTLITLTFFILGQSVWLLCICSDPFCRKHQLNWISSDYSFLSNLSLNQNFRALPGVKTKAWAKAAGFHPAVNISWSKRTSGWIIHDRKLCCLCLIKLIINMPQKALRRQICIRTCSDREKYEHEGMFLHYRDVNLTCFCLINVNVFQEQNSPTNIN